MCQLAALTDFLKSLFLQATVLSQRNRAVYLTHQMTHEAWACADHELPALIKDYEALLKRLVQDFQFNFRQPALKLLNFIYIILKCLFIRLTLTFTRTRARRGTKVDQFNPPAKKRKKKRASFDQRRLVGYLLYT